MHSLPVVQVSQEVMAFIAKMNSKLPKEPIQSAEGDLKLLMKYKVLMCVCVCVGGWVCGCVGVSVCVCMCVYVCERESMGGCVYASMHAYGPTRL